MALIVVAGVVDDEVFQHVALIANHLSTVLPNFTVRQISKRKDKWEKWLKKECSKRGWHHTKSPIVWKEMSMRGGRAVLLGGASGFWEYLKEYYDVMSYFNKEQKSQLLLDKIQVFAQEEKLKESELEVRRVCIIGAGHPMTSLLLMELLRIPELLLKNGVVISLCDAMEFQEILKRLTKDVTAMAASPGLACVRVTGDLKHALINCDLCLILQHADSERNGQEFLPWLYYNYQKMIYIADALKSRAPHRCRVILAAAGEVPLCFNAHVIADIAKNLSVRNIVVVTADLALESLETLAREANVPRNTIGQPPVWGFLGVNKLVDLYKAYHVVEVFKPDADSTRKYPLGSTLCPGTRTVEVRNMAYLLQQSKGIHLNILFRKLQIEETLERSTYIAKVKATVDLVRHWYGNDDVCLSLGICSNGSFGLPHGLYFSQPARLVAGKWKPFSSYPLPDDVNCRLVDLTVLPMHVLKYFNLGQRFNAIWLMPVESKALKQYSSDIRHTMLASMRNKLKSLASQQQLLALTTGNKISEIREQHIKFMKERREQNKAERFETLKRRKLIALFKERQKENREREAEGPNEEEEEELLKVTEPLEEEEQW